MPHMAPRLELFPFRFRNPVTGKWKRARYLAEGHEIEARYQLSAMGNHCGRQKSAMLNPADARYFRSNVGAAPKRPVNEPPKNPLQGPKKDPPVPESPVEEPPDDDPATLDGLERFLLLVFLRRYVTYRARRRRYAAMNGAARLFREVSASPGNSVA